MKVTQINRKKNKGISRNGTMVTADSFIISAFIIRFSVTFHSQSYIKAGLNNESNAIPF